MTLRRLLDLSIFEEDRESDSRGLQALDLGGRWEHSASYKLSVEFSVQRLCELEHE